MNPDTQTRLRSHLRAGDLVKYWGSVPRFNDLGIIAEVSPHKVVVSWSREGQLDHTIPWIDELFDSGELEVISESR
jgi:hypothetical protein